MAFCYLHVVSHGLARVILPEPILDRSAGVSYKKLVLLEKRKTFLTQLIKENAIPPATEVAGFLAEFL